MAIAEIALILGSCLLCTSGWAPPKVSDMAIKSCWVKAGYHHHPKKKNGGMMVYK